jgi:hypothetical protein
MKTFQEFAAANPAMGDKVIQWVKEYEQFPLPQRIAARLHLEDWTEMDLRTVPDFHEHFRSPYFNKVYNELHDIDTGFLKITPDLRRLALQL